MKRKNNSCDNRKVARPGALPAPGPFMYGCTA